MEIAPVGIGLFDQGNFPGPQPLFQTLLAMNCRSHRMMVLIPDQLADAVFLREAFRTAVLVVANPHPQGTGHADVNRSVLLTGDDVDGRLFLNSRGVPPRRDGSSAFAEDDGLTIGPIICHPRSQPTVTLRAGGGPTIRQAGPSLGMTDDWACISVSFLPSSLPAQSNAPARTGSR